MILQDFFSRAKHVFAKQPATYGGVFPQKAKLLPDQAATINETNAVRSSDSSHTAAITVFKQASDDALWLLQEWISWPI